MSWVPRFSVHFSVHFRLARLQPTMHVGLQALLFVPTAELALQATTSVDFPGPEDGEGLGGGLGAWMVVLNWFKQSLRYVYKII